MELDDYSESETVKVNKSEFVGLFISLRLCGLVLPHLPRAFL